MAIYRRPNSSYWWMHFEFNGRHFQRSTKCRNKREAEAVERAYRTQLAKGEVGFAEKKQAPRFSDAVREFVAWVEVEHQAKPNTIASYTNSTNALLEFFGDKRLDNINPGQVEKFKIWRTKQRCKPKSPSKRRKAKRRKKLKLLAPATVNRELAVLKMLFNYFIKSGHLKENPVSKVKMLKESPPTERVISTEEERLYLMAATQPLQDVAAIMLDTGMRPGEVLNLKVEDVHLDDSYLFIPEGKTHNARRMIPLTTRAKEILMLRSREMKKGLLFANEETGKPFTTLKTGHAGALRRSGVEHFRLYDLRHTFATRFVESGGDLMTLKELLGHAKIQMVTRYAHPTNSHKFEAIKRMETLVPSRSLSAVAGIASDSH